MPITQINPYYNAGTATFTTDSAIVVGQGTSWLTNVEPGDQVFDRLGRKGPAVLTVDSNTQLTLAKPWRNTGQTATDYEIYRVPDSVRLENFSQRMVNLLVGGNLTSFGSLDGTDGDWIGVFAGAGALVRKKFTAAMQQLADDPDFATMRATLGVQPALGYSAVNKAGDTMTGVLRNTAHPVLRAHRTNNAENFPIGAQLGVLGSMSVNQGGFTPGGTTGGSDAGLVVHVPATGYYHIMCPTYFTAAGSGRLNVVRNGSPSNVLAFAQCQGANQKVTGHGVALLTAGDHLSYYVSQAAISVFTNISHTELIVEYLG